MTLYVQNDTGTTEYANSYVTVDEFRAYWTARGVTYAQTDATLETWLIPARFYEDNRYEYAGYKTNGRAQYTEFPRDELYDYGGYNAVLVTGVPREIKDAQCEYAAIFGEEGTLQPPQSTTGSIKKKREKIDVLEEEIEYSPAGQTGGLIQYPQADKCIPGDFIANATGGFTTVHM